MPLGRPRSAFLARLVGALALAFAVPFAPAQAEVAIPPVARVTDLTGTLTAAQRAALSDKLAAFEALLVAEGLAAGQIAYMGDDIVDLPVLRRCGLAVTVPNAPEEVLARCHYVTRSGAGRGAAREVCELIMRAQGSWAEQLALYDR